jgi:N-acetylglucosaminyldiphosphoundecaprenol N-acetyl-beta-D-mannosaminyltransferase
MMVQSKFRRLEESPNLDVYLLGRRISCMTVSAIVDAIHTACIKGLKITVANYNVHSFNLSMQVPWYYDFLQGSEITHCDSVGILQAIRFMGLKLPLQYRVSYSLLMPELLAHCNQHGFSLFLLGAKPEHLNAAIAHLREQYPNMSVDGHHGYFNMEDLHQNDRVVEQINRARPNILIVGMGMPIQENWIRRNRHQLNVNAIMPGGAIIDRLAGIVPDCPRFLSNIGLEWFYRLYREPKRLAARYLLGNPAFILHIALAKTFSYSLTIRQMKPLGNSKGLSCSDGYEDEQAGVKCIEGEKNESSSLKEYLIETGLIDHHNAKTYQLRITN